MTGARINLNQEMVKSVSSCETTNERVGYNDTVNNCCKCVSDINLQDRHNNQLL